MLLRDKTNGYNRAIKLMVENQRRVHAQNSTVGQQVVTIPRDPQIQGLIMSDLDGTEIPCHSASFGYFDRRGFRYEQRGPLLSFGGQVIDQINGTADSGNPDNQEISFRFVKVPPPPPRPVRPTKRAKR